MIAYDVITTVQVNKMVFIINFLALLLIYFFAATYTFLLIFCWAALFYGAYINLCNWAALPPNTPLKLRQEFE